MLYYIQKVEKICLIFLLILLTSCKDKETSVSCTLYNNDNSLTYTFLADYDVIKDITLKRTFKIPYNTLFNDEFLNDLKEQLDSSYIIEDNYLIQTKKIENDKNYSLAKTITYLKENKYACK